MADPWLKPNVENDFPFTPPAHMMEIADFAEYWGGNARGSTADRAALLPFATPGQSIFDTDLSAWYIKIGSTWKVAIEDTGWIAPGSMGAGWVNYGSSFETCEYRRLNGMVVIKGLVKLGTATTIFTLPAGFRPAQIVVKQQSAFTGLARMTIAPTGAIGITGYYNGGTNADVSLNMTFAAEQ